MGSLQETVLWPLLGGVLIGIAATLMLYLNGRVTGISGILNGFLTFKKPDIFWRGSFLLGLILAGAAFYQAQPTFFANTTDRSYTEIAVAGLLVGFGTVLSGGCTSGHGVCGISRFSRRSIVATIVFMIAGMALASLWRAA